ncbi:MAG: sodium:solute symporter family protein [bacterium]|nr:sodium:solute symporter family protein [bacterium]
MIVKATVIGLYALTIIIVGVIGLKKTRSFSDFFLGGGNVGPWMTAFSYGTAYFSAVLFIGFAGKIGWAFGYSGLWIALLNSFVGVLGVWGIMGWKIKKMSVEYKVSTIGEFLEKRYNSPFIKFFTSAAIFIFMIPYSAAVFMGLSYLFTTNFGIPYWVALVTMGIFTATYLVLGGYKSMTMIDTIFGGIMTVGVIVLYFSTTAKGGGLAAITAKLTEISPKLTEAVGPPGWWPLFSLIFLTSVAPFAMPQLVQKFYAIKDKRSIKIGMVASTFFAILIGGVAYFIGSTTRIFLSPANNPGTFKDGKPIFDRLMPELLTNVIPESLSVLILLLILSASMSTLAALVLISSSAIAKDFYAGFINKNVSDKNLTALMRFMSAFFVLLSVILAYMNFDTIVSILGISWGAIGAVFLGPFVWGLFNKNITKIAAISSSVLGLAICLVLYFKGMPSPQAGTIGMIASLVIAPLFSITHLFDD